MNKIKETITHITFSVFSHTLSEKFMYDLGGEYRSLGKLEHVYIEREEETGIVNIHLSFPEFVAFFHDVKVEQIIFEKCK